MARLASQPAAVVCRIIDTRTSARAVSTLIFATAVGVLRPGSAGAQLNICNRTNETISVAIGMQTANVWTTAGWYVASPGSCVTPITGSLRSRYYYVHGRSASGTWGNDRSFCVLRGSAFQSQNSGDCESSGFNTADFTRIDTGASTSYTFNLDSAVPTDAQTVHSAIDAIRVTWRLSLAIENTWIMVMHNDRSYDVSFSVRCYTRDGGRSKAFSVVVAPYGLYEIGFVQGWDNNFVSGEYCDAYHGSERVWRATAPVDRGGR